MYDAGNPKSVLHDNLEGCGREGGERFQEGGDTCMSMADSCCYMVKTITIL